MLEELQKRNPEQQIFSTEAPEFLPYGKVHHHISVPEMRRFLREQPMPQTELYIPSEKTLMDLPEAEQFTRYVFAQTACQIGYYLAYNSKLNALEYHKCSEILALDTDVVLLLAKIEDIVDDVLETEKIKAFYVPAGAVVELYATSLHFSPCMVSREEGVRQVVVQSEGTNTPLRFPVENKLGENKFLLERNKWVLAHREATGLIAQGAYVGLIGDNVEIRPL